MLVSYLIVALIPLLLLVWSYRTGLDKSAELEKAQLMASLERTCIALNKDAEKWTRDVYKRQIPASHAGHTNASWLR